MTEKKTRAKHVGYAGQREFCRNNKHTYIEKFNGDPVLMCNYPFSDPYHKKGVCRAATCTDMRQIPKEITDADDALGEVATDKAEETVEVPGEVQTEKLTPCPTNE